MNKESTLQDLRRLLPYIRSSLKYGILMAGIILVQSSLAMIDPVLLGRVVDTISTPQDEALNVLLALVAIYLVVVVSRIVLEWFSNWSTVLFSTRLIQTLRTRVLGSMFRSDLLFWNHRFSTGDLITRATEDIAKIEGFLTDTAINPITDAVRMVIAVGVMASLNWRLALSAVPLLAGAPLLHRAWASRIKQASKAQRETSSTLANHLTESIQSIDLIQACNQERRRLGEHSQLLEKDMSQTVALMLMQMSGPITAEMIGVITIHGLILGLGGYFVLTGQMTVGALIAFLTYSSRVSSPVVRLLRTNMGLQRVSASIRRVLEIIESNTYREVVTDTMLPITDAAPAVSCDALSFTYPKGEQPAVNHVDIAVQPGETIAIVGHNGSGKSTMARLLLGFIKPADGRICVNGVELTTETAASLRDVIGIVDQQARVFNASLRDNIAFGKPDATIDEVRAVARLVNLDDYIMSLPNGYETIVGQGGLSLSGGEKQKINLARCLLRDPSIIILDEPATSLDIASELDMMRALRSGQRNRTIIHITHRLEHVKSYDRIYVMGKGTVVQMGKHSQLINQPGEYQSLWESLGSIDKEVSA